MCCFFFFSKPFYFVFNPILFYLLSFWSRFLHCLDGCLFINVIPSPKSSFLSSQPLPLLCPTPALELVVKDFRRFAASLPSPPPTGSEKEQCFGRIIKILRVTFSAPKIGKKTKNENQQKATSHPILDTCELPICLQAPRIHR